MSFMCRSNAPPTPAARGKGGLAVYHTDCFSVPHVLVGDDAPEKGMLDQEGEDKRRDHGVEGDEWCVI